MWARYDRRGMGWRKSLRSSSLQRNLASHSVLNRHDCGFMRGAPPFALRFANTEERSHLLAVVGEEGYVTLLDTSNSDALPVQHRFLAHENAVFECQWSPGDTHMATAAGDETVALWDLKSTSSPLCVLGGHSGSIKAVRWSRSNPCKFESLPLQVTPLSPAFCSCPAPDLLASGSRGGILCLHDLRVPTMSSLSRRGSPLVPPVLSSRTAHAIRQPGRRALAGTATRSVTAVELSTAGHLLISGGASDG
jgi:WD40 repeat protein